MYSGALVEVFDCVQKCIYSKCQASTPLDYQTTAKDLCMHGWNTIRQTVTINNIIMSSVLNSSVVKCPSIMLQLQFMNFFIVPGTH